MGRAALPAWREDGLPDPYEPLIILYERGGGFYIEEFVDLNGVMIWLGDAESNASATPFLTLRPTTLDALDADGEITYYAGVGDGHSRDNPAGIVRRRVDDDLTHDEAFTSNLRWAPTEYLALHDLGHDDEDHVEITEIEAATFVEWATSAPGMRPGRATRAWLNSRLGDGQVDYGFRTGGPPDSSWRTSGLTGLRPGRRGGWRGGAFSVGFLSEMTA